MSTARKKKLLVVGAKGYSADTDTYSLRSVRWEDIRSSFNLADHDVVVLSLLGDSVRPNILIQTFLDVFTVGAMMSILGHGGMIIILGDPRFEIREREHYGKFSDFLRWTAISFTWNDLAGTTIEHDSPDKEYLPYLSFLRNWKYSLVYAGPNVPLLSSMFPREFLNGTPVEYKVQVVPFCSNRFQNAIAFHTTLQFGFRHRPRHVEEWETVREFPNLILLPEIALPENETIALVLNDICGVAVGLSEPDWVKELVVPGQKPVDDEISHARQQIAELEKQIDALDVKRTAMRRPLRLLYDEGETLEVAVRDVLRELTFEVEDPIESGKEDGWLRYQSASVEGVLEVKGTRKDQFDELGIKQLHQWVQRGATMRQKKYKGVYVGNNAREKKSEDRPDPYNKNWVKSLTVSDFVSITTSQLYEVYVAHLEGRLDTEAFCKAFLAAVGPFDPMPFIK